MDDETSTRVFTSILLFATVISLRQIRTILLKLSYFLIGIPPTEVRGLFCVRDQSTKYAFQIFTVRQLKRNLLSVLDDFTAADDISC